MLKFNYFIKGGHKLKKILSLLLIVLILTAMLPITQVQAATKSAAAYLADGNKYLTQSKYPDALKSFDAAVKINTKYTEAYVGKGRALAGLKNYIEAIKAYDKAIALNKKHAPAYYHKGISLIALKKYPDSIKAFDAAIAQNPKYSEAYNQKGIIFSMLSKHNDALVAFNKAAQLSPKQSDIYFKRGMTYRALGKYKEAINDLKEAIKLNPASVSVFTGTTNKGIYNNEYLNMTMKVPQEWIIQDNTTVLQLVEQLVDKASAEELSNSLNSFLCLMASKYALGAPVEFNPNVTLGIENVSLLDGISKGSDYLFFLEKTITEVTPGYTFEDKTETVILDGISFDTKKAVFNIADREIKQKIYCTIYKGFSVFFTLSYSTEEELQELETMLKTVYFVK